MSCDVLDKGSPEASAGIDVEEGEGETSNAFLYSPLMYWNCSSAAIETDASPTKTINRKIHHPALDTSPVGPTSVFVGTTISNSKVVAANALVVTLFYKGESGAGALWDRKAEELSQYGDTRLGIYSPSPSGFGSTLFSLDHLPLGLQERVVLLSVYILIVIYLIIKIRHTSILKSRFGSFVAITLQCFFSILSALSVAAYMRIDISRIPLEVFPIPLIVGLENMFRLVHELENTSEQDSSIRRVASALGAVGHLSVIAVAQNLAILWLLLKIASPGLAAFCGFATISLVIDLVYFFTYFPATLTLAISDYGLQDSFDAKEPHSAMLRTSSNVPFPTSKGRQSHRQSLQGSLLYARLVTAIVVVSFTSVLAVNSAEGNLKFHLFRMFAAMFHESGFTGVSEYWHNGLHRFKGSEATTWWFNNLEYKSTKQILQFANIEAQHSLIAKVYDPLVIRLKLVNSTDSMSQEPVSFPPMDSIFGGRVDPLTVFLCSTLVLSLLIQKRRSSKNAFEETEGRLSKRKEVSTINYLPRGHTLDVFMLAASSKQYLVSVGYDHEFRIWNLEAQSAGSRLMIPISSQHILWPAAAIAVDDRAEWIAICSKAGGVSLWDIKLQCFRRSIETGLGSRIVACFFTPSTHSDGLRPVTHLLIVFAVGLLTDINVETGNFISHQICNTPIRASHITAHKRSPLRLITISEDEKISITVKREDYWASQALQFSIPILRSPARLRFTVVPHLRMVGLVLNEDTDELHLIDFLSGAAIYTFRQKAFKHRTLRAIHSAPQQCLTCGAVALVSFSIAYTNEDDGSFTMRTLTADQNSRSRTSLICLRAERDMRERRCVGLAGGIEKTYTIQNAGVWETTAANGVAGVRPRRRNPKTASRDSFPRKNPSNVGNDQDIDEDWEAWTMTASGITNYHRINSSMFTSRVGPLCSVGRNAIAVGLAEGIALLQFGSQLKDNDDDDDDNMSIRRLPRAKIGARTKSHP
ncbi:sterol-sensing domain of SREBP cleavage-activation-domain-containing protein [Tricladium varicosporioides]|nr:sterol-sensing domain of SREBP cleavage-activation-domain-containing protein [Hymenoscyphus varicosporioides]